MDGMARTTKIPMDKQVTENTLTRRDFLKKAGAAGAALALPFTFNIGTATGQRQRFAGKTLTVLIMGGVTSYSGPFYDAARQFEEQFGASVQLVESPYTGMREKVIIDVVTGTGAYDVIHLAVEWDGETYPYMMDLTPLIERDGFDLDDYHPKALQVMGHMEGKRFGIPYLAGSYALIYRRDIFEQEGLEPPTDWDTYMRYCQLFKEKYTPRGIYATSFAVQGGSAWKSWSSRYWAQGARLFDDSYQPLYASPAGVRAFEMLQETIPYAPPDILTYDNPEMTAIFLNGRVVMSEHWPDFVAADAEDPTKSQVVGKVGYAPIPGGANLNAWSVGIAETSREKEMAWEFIKLLSSKENVLRWMKEYGTNVTRLSALEHDPFRRSLLDNGRIIPLQQPIFGEWWDAANKMTSEVLTGQKTAMQALQDNANLWRRLLRETPAIGGPYAGD